MSTIRINVASIRLSGNILSFNGFARSDVAGAGVTVTVFDQADGSSMEANLLGMGALTDGDIWNASVPIVLRHSYAIDAVLSSPFDTLAEDSAFTGLLGTVARKRKRAAGAKPKAKRGRAVRR